MKALVYLLGARALDLARDRDSVHPRRAEELPGPLATAEATAAAWRRWGQQGKESAATTDRSRRGRSGTPAPRPAPG